MLPRRVTNWSQFSCPAPHPLPLVSRGCFGCRQEGHTCHLLLPPGEVFFITRLEQFTFQEALAFCESHNATLASTGQLYAAWSQGLDKCYAGWLSDGSLRYPIVTPRPSCGGDKPGVRTVYLYPNQTGLPDPLSRHHAFCFRGMCSPLSSSLPSGRGMTPLGLPFLAPVHYPHLSEQGGKSQPLWSRGSFGASMTLAIDPKASASF